jgi:glycosyltransferase involved in cell wall biosynthesis
MHAAGMMTVEQGLSGAKSSAASPAAASPSPAVDLPLTLLVMTRNEAANIAACLDSVPFAQEKIVIDSGSEDNTATIAQAHGARVVSQPWLGYGRQRNFATTQAHHKWILFLDADECLSAPLATEIVIWLPRLMRNPATVGLLPRATHFMGRPMRWYRPMRREYKARLYHVAHACWSEPRVHESLKFIGPVVKFRGELEHRHDPTLVHVQLKALKYAELKALDRVEQGRAVRPWSWPLVFAATFLKDYLLRLAVLDGARGWIAAYLNAHYTVYKRLRQYEMQQVAGSATLAEAVLAPGKRLSGG